MKTVTVTLFAINELTDEVKSKVLDKFRDINVNDDWWDSIYDDAKEIGLKITSFNIDRNRHAEGKFLLAANEVAQNILNNHGENCETYKTASSFMEYWQPVFNDYIHMDESSKKHESEEAEEELQEMEDSFLDSLLEDYSIMLQKQYEFLMEDEAVEETLTINEYQFLENGKRFN
jgi:hypothetical protein